MQKNYKKRIIIISIILVLWIAFPFVYWSIGEVIYLTTDYDYYDDETNEAEVYKIPAKRVLNCDDINAYGLNISNMRLEGNFCKYTLTVKAEIKYDCYDWRCKQSNGICYCQQTYLANSTRVYDENGFYRTKYYCTNGELDNYNKCVKSFTKPASQSYSCPIGYTQKGLECEKEEQIIADYYFTCPSGYSLFGAECIMD